jgi:hypothetical protein
MFQDTQNVAALESAPVAEKPEAEAKRKGVNAMAFNNPLAQAAAVMQNTSAMLREFVSKGDLDFIADAFLELECADDDMGEAIASLNSLLNRISREVIGTPYGWSRTKMELTAAKQRNRKVTPAGQVRDALKGVSKTLTEEQAKRILAILAE